MVTFLEARTSERSVPHSRPHDPRGRLGVVLGWGLALAVATGVLLVGLELGALTATAAVYALGAGFALWLMKTPFPFPTLGWGNLITVGRMGLMAGLVAAALSPADPWLVVAVAILALVLDGFDGWFARRQNRVSLFGARLDMEVDAALTVVLALTALAAGSVGPLVLVLAIPRYVFVAAAAVLPWLRAELPESQARKVMLVVQVTALITLQVPGLLWGLAPVVVALVGAGLLWSFGRDIVGLWRNRHHLSLASDVT